MEPPYKINKPECIISYDNKLEFQHIIRNSTLIILSHLVTLKKYNIDNDNYNVLLNDIRSKLCEIERALLLFNVGGTDE